MKKIILILVFAYSFAYGGWVENVKEKHYSLMKSPPVGNWKYIDSITTEKNKSGITFNFWMKSMNKKAIDGLNRIHTVYLKNEGQNPSSSIAKFMPVSQKYKK